MKVKIVTPKHPTEFAGTFSRFASLDSAKPDEKKALAKFAKRLAASEEKKYSGMRVTAVNFHSLTFTLEMERK